MSYGAGETFANMNDAATQEKGEKGNSGSVVAADDAGPVAIYSVRVAASGMVAKS